MRRTNRRERKKVKGRMMAVQKTMKETAELVVALARREQDDKCRMVQVRGVKKPQTVAEVQEGIVGMLPNVNLTLARRLLREFKTVKAVVCAGDDELLKVEGIGEEKAKKIRDVVERVYDE